MSDRPLWGIDVHGGCGSPAEMRRWDDEQGGVANAVKDVNETGHAFYRFPSGASRSVGWPCQMWDAHPDPHEHAKQLERYWRVLRHQETQKFHQMKERLASMAVALRNSGYGVPDDSEIEKLKEQQKLVQEIQDKHLAAKQRVTDTIPDHVKRRAARTAQNREQSESALSVIKGIRI